MPVKRAAPADLEPIETASREPPRGAPARAPAAGRSRTPTSTCRTIGASSTLPAFIPRDLKDARRPREVSVHHQGRSSRQLSVRDVRGAARRDRAHPRVVRHDRQADRRRLHGQGHRHVVDGDGALDPRGRRASGGHHPRRVRLRPFHRRPGRALRCRKARRHRDSDVGRHDRAAGAAHPRFQARHHHGDAVVHARDCRGDGAARAESARLVAQDRHLRRRAVDARDADGASRRRSRSTRSTSTDFPRSSARASRRNASRPRTGSRSGRTISIPRSSIRRREPCCATARRASSCSRRSPRKRCR